MITRIVGTPWLELGRDPADGLDCLGLLIYYYCEGLKVTVSDPFSLVPTEITGHTFFHEWEKIPDPEVHCGVEFGTEGGVRHLGVMTPHGVLHAVEKTGAILTPPQRIAQETMTFHRHKDYVAPK